MRTVVATLCIGALAAASFVQAAPGKPEDNGLSPVSATLYVNTPDTINNGKTESLGIAIARNGNVMVGWEDDGAALSDLEAVWVLLDRDGKLLSQDKEITTLDARFVGQTLTSHFFSLFRTNGTPIPGRTAWGPKIKANLFGAGLGMGVTGFDLGIEVPELAPIQFTVAGANAGDFPAVQLLSDNGEPTRIVSGVSDAYAERDGDIRVADWDYLGNGRVVIAGESRQKADLVSEFGGIDPQNHAIFRIVDAQGKEVKSVQLASSVATKSEMWHGLAVTKNGFAIRFAGDDGRAKVRLFDNNGVAVTTNLDLGTVTGNELAAQGGRGDGIGFIGNGNDAYALATGGSDTNGDKRVFVTVLNANGSVRWAKVASDDLVLNGPGRCDVGIDALGRVVVAYDDTAGTDGNARLVLGRLFDAKGVPIGGTFHVSENELPNPATLAATAPRVAFRNDTVAIAWESLNSGSPDKRVVATRLFVLPVRPGSIESVGLTRIVADTPVINQGLDALGNWEPYASVLGTSTFLIEGNAFADQTTDKQRFVVALQPAAGGPARTVEAVYSDDGNPFKGEINASRQNGNPGRVAGDPRPGSRNYIIGVEASPHFYAPFQSGNRWNTGYDRVTSGAIESRYGAVQTFQLDTAALVPTPRSKLFDSANGRITSGQVASDQNSRFGGDVIALGNGNFVSAVEDKSKIRNPDGSAAVATIIAPDGTIVKESFKVANGDLWSNIAAFKGGFVVRVAGVLYFHDNDGNLTGSLDQNTSGESFDRGRGDGTRIAGHINSPYVYLASRVTAVAVVRVAVWNAVTREFVTLADVSEGGFRATADRATVAVDALNRFIVSWVSQPEGYEQPQIAARVMAFDEGTKTVKPLTASFLPLVNNHPVGIKTLQMSVAMTTKQILVAAKGFINLQNKPGNGPNSPGELNFYTVFSHPVPKDDPTPAVSGGGLLLGAVTPGGNHIKVTWTGGKAPYTVQKRANLASGTWNTVTTTSDRFADVPVDGDTGFVRVLSP